MERTQYYNQGSFLLKTLTWSDQFVQCEILSSIHTWVCPVSPQITIKFPIYFLTCPLRCKCVSGVVPLGLDWRWLVGVVSNYLDEKLHQPPITDIQPYHRHYTTFRTGFLWIPEDVQEKTKVQIEIEQWVGGLITDEVGVSVYWEDQTAIDCRSAAGSPSSSYGGAHPRSKKVLWYFARLPISSQIFSQAALYLVFRDKIFPKSHNLKEKWSLNPKLNELKVEISWESVTNLLTGVPRC